MAQFRISRRAFGASLLASSALSACAIRTEPAAKARVVVVGGGFGGAAGAGTGKLIARCGADALSHAARGSSNATCRVAGAGRDFGATVAAACA
jgi:sulfide dehydrogenase [flavocytochrome c] flavoprotein subunit